MKKKMPLFTQVGLLILVGLVFLVSELFVVRSQAQNLELRQTKSGRVVGKNCCGSRVSDQDATLNLRLAGGLAEKMEFQKNILEEVSTMGFLQRWHQGIDLPRLQYEYSNLMKNHLKAMTVVLKAHTQKKGFKNMKEIEFQSLLNKSDYLLNLDISQRVISEAMNIEEWRQEFSQTLQSYNVERWGFDRKKIFVAGQ